MMDSRMKRTSMLVGPAAALMLLVGSLSDEPVVAQEPRGPSPLGQYFGFQPVEIFKLERRSSNLVARDIDRDGLVDLVLADNSHSRIDYLHQRKQKPAGEPVKDPDGEVNAVESDWRFEHRKIPVDRQINALVVGDFNADGRPDLAYLGAPNYLVVRFQPKTGEWSETVEFRIPDLNPLRGNLATGDLDGNGTSDLVVLGKFETSIFFQSEQGKLGTPRQLMNTSAQLGLATVNDLDGDGRQDLCYTTVEAQKRQFCVRLQDSTGRLGPEMRLKLPAHRDVQLQNLDGRRGHELVLVESSTNRVKLLKVHGPGADDDAEQKQRLIQYGFGRQGASRTESLRDVAIGDVDGDGRIDVVVSDPAGARVIVFRQRPTGGLDLGTAFPGLDDTRHVKIGNVDGEAGNEVVVVSVKEKTLGLSRMTDGRLGFPKPLAVGGDPLACVLLDVDGKPGLEIVYVAKPEQGTGYVLGALARGGDGTLAPHSFGKLAQVPVTLKGTPHYLLAVDANRDGRSDLLVFQDLEQPPVLMITQADGSLKAVATSGGIQLGDIDPGQLFVGRLEQQSILVAQQKFARSVALTPQGAWQVIDQYNVTESNAKIAGVAALELDGTPGKEIVLIDTGVRQLRVMRREGEGKLFKPWREVELGTLAYRANRIADFNGDKREDLLLVGNGKFAVLYTGRKGLRVEELASFEPRRKQALFVTTVSGDLNGDGRIDVAVIDRRDHRISLLDHSPAHGLRHALDFRVFEQKSFRGAAGGGSEPREAVIADVTGDDHPDLVLLVHDRVLVYPQDTVPDPKAKPKPKTKAKKAAARE